MNLRARLRSRLYEGVCFVHAEGTETGDRYRLANRTAERYVHRLEREFLHRARLRELRNHLRRFHRAGQTEKLELARAA